MYVRSKPHNLLVFFMKQNICDDQYRCNCTSWLCTVIDNLCAIKTVEYSNLHGFFNSVHSFFYTCQLFVFSSFKFFYFKYYPSVSYLSQFLIKIFLKRLVEWSCIHLTTISKDWRCMRIYSILVWNFESRCMCIYSILVWNFQRREACSTVQMCWSQLFFPSNLLVVY